MSRRFFIPFFTTFFLVVSALFAYEYNFDHEASVVKLQHANIQTGMPDGHGSAVHLGNGYFLTAKHVVNKNNKTFTVILQNGNKHEVELVAVSEQHDLALVKIIDPENFRLVSTSLNCSTPDIWSNLKTVGNPSALEFIRASGYVASRVHSLGPFPKIYIWNGTVLPGQSGAPVFDHFGAIRGIIVAVITSTAPTPFGGISSPTGYGMVVPSSVACDFVKEHKPT